MLNFSFLLKAGTVAGLGILGTSVVIKDSMGQYNANILKPIDTVSIIMPSYNEEQFIELSASSIRRQSIIQEYPEYFQFILADSCSTDNTIELASPYVDKIIITSRGKLTARNEATDQANGNIIVSVDADTYYPYHWLNSLLEPFNNLNHSSIIGVSGSTFDYTAPYVPNSLYIVGDTLYNKISNRYRMVGRNSAYYKDAFYLAGKFDESINQFQILEIFREEERLFGVRLSKLGKVIYKLNAACYHLGGKKSFGRLFGVLGLENNTLMNEYKFGKDRF